MSHLWQNPYVNVFKHFDVASWKKASKEGDVTIIMDKTQKCSVYRIRGAVPAANYLQLPLTASQSLGLAGRRLYLLFRPTRARFFLVHVDVATRDGLVVRVSFSNMYREARTTPTWLQFPFVCRPAAASVDARTRDGNADVGVCAPAVPRWTLLRLDLQEILSTYAGRNYSHVKSIRLCANMLVRNIFTSNTDYLPGLTLDQVKKAGASLQAETAMPREMAFPVAKGEKWHDHYDYIRFPSDSNRTRYDSMRSFQQSDNETSPKKIQQGIAVRVERAPSTGKSARPHRQRGAVTTVLPPVGVGEDYDDVGVVRPSVENEVHAYPLGGEKGTLCGTARVKTKQLKSPTEFSAKPDDYDMLLPDPILKLKRIVGFGGCTTRDAVWTSSGTTMVYPCHAIIIAMQASNGHQRFFVGHTDKVSCLSLDSSSSLLASGQTGPQSVVRVWRFSTAHSLAMFKAHAHSLHCLSFSHSGGVLCGVGKDSHGKTMVVIWNTEAVSKAGQVSVLAKAHTDVDITRMRIAAFDDTRMVSCGRDNIRMWRIKSGSLRSAPVDLHDHHNMTFTDCCFEAGYAATKDPLDRIVYACSQSGYLIEVDYRKVAIQNVRRLLPVSVSSSNKQSSHAGASCCISSMCVNEAFCVTGSDDGYLRLWPLDFKHVYLEAQHDGAVTAVDIASDGVKILAGTASGNLGILDISTRGYTTVMRSHSRRVLALDVDPLRRHLATVSEDSTIRVWDLNTMQQLYDFSAPQECPCAIVYHPRQQLFACGFQSGVVRVFDVASTSMLAEHRQHRSPVTGLVFPPSGLHLLSSGSHGSLALYDATAGYRLLRLLNNTVARGDAYGPTALAVSPDGRFVAFVGPTSFTVSVVDAKTLDEVLRIDVSSTTAALIDGRHGPLEAASRVTFAPAGTRHLLVTTANNRLLRYDALNGKLQTELNNIHRGGCTALDVSQDGRLLVTAGDNVVKIWDYYMRFDINFQIFIGHSERISSVVFTPDTLSLISTGDAIFIWDLLSNVDKAPLLEGRCKVKNYFTGEDEEYSPYESVTRRDLSSRDASPRRRAPQPTAPHHRPTPPPPSGGDASTPSHIDAITQRINCELADQFTNQNVIDDPTATSLVRSDEDDDDSPPSQDDSQIVEIVATKPSPRVHRHCWKDDPLPASDVPAASSPTCVIGGGARGVVLTGGGARGISVTGGGAKADSGRKKADSAPPTVHKHFVAKPKSHSLALRRYTAPPNQAGLKLSAVIGYNGNGRENMVWQPDTGLFIYTSGCLVIIEDLNAGTQQHLIGHKEEISTLTLQHDCAVLASSSGSHDGTSPSEICLWDLEQMTLKKTLHQNAFDIVCLAYSRDDRLLISVGDYRSECQLVVWCAHSHRVLATSRCARAVHSVRWDPYSAAEFTTVGDGGALLFWLLDETTTGGGGATAEVALSVHQVEPPADLLQTHAVGSGDVHLTCVVYAGNSTLYTGSSNGKVAAWDTRHNSCFLHWDADTAEIGMLLSGPGRLVTGGAGGSVRLWSVAGVAELRLPGDDGQASYAADGALTMEDEMKLDGAVVSAAFDDSLDMGIVGTSAGTLWYINWAERGSIRLVSGHSSEITAIGMSGSDLLASCSADGGLRVWDVAAREQMLQFQVGKQSCHCVAFSPRAAALPPPAARGPAGRPPPPLPSVAAGYSDGSVRVFDLSRVEMSLKTQPHAASVSAICFMADSSMLLSGARDGAIAVSSMTTGMTMRLISDHSGASITCLDCAPSPPQGEGWSSSPRGWLAASADRRVSVWTADWTRDFCELVDWLTFPAPAFTPEGDTICAGQKQDLPPTLARFSLEEPDIIVYTGYGMQKLIQFYNLVQKRVVRTIALGQWASCLDLCPSTPVLAVGNKERLVKLLDYYEASFQDFEGHDDSVSLLKFSSNGRLLFSVAGAEILVWNLTL